MNFFDIILWPLRWVIELILVGAHSFWSFLGLPADSGWTWVLSVLVIVLVVRSAMIPLMVRQIKSMRGMMELQPELKKIQDKYKGKRDQFSQQAMQQETMALYTRHGSSPLSSCWPMLIQMPIFFSLYRVLNAANHQEAGVGLMSQDHAVLLANSEIFGAPLSSILSQANGNTNVIIVAIVLIVLMVATQFFTQRQITSQNISEAAKASPMFRQQQMLMYLLPLVMAVSGIMFPIGVMIYWFLTNVWTTGQQWWTIRNMPTPGSDAYKKRVERLKERGKWENHPDNPANRIVRDGKTARELELEAQEKKSQQRQQPVSKQRQKKKKKK
jgi:YidC/Oxa1 family membrane protein insertase